MNIELLDGKAIVVQQGDNVWLLGCPEGVGVALKEAGVIPTAVLLTRVGAPGLHELEGKPLVVRATPLRIGGLEAKPIGRVHGWDYAVKSDDGSLLWTERGDVSARDVYGYSLALIGNKHRSDAFGDNIITRPWPETAQYIVSDGAWQTTTKPWSSMDDVPPNMKKLDGTPLTLEQANWIARVASGSGKDGKENWAIGISAFKKAHTVKDGAWVKNEAKDEEDKPPDEKVKEGALDETMDSGTILPEDEMVTDYWTDTEQATEADEEVKKELPDWLPSELEAPGVAFKEQADGRWRWYAHTANDTRDLQNEVIPSEAIDWSMAVATVLNDKGPFLFRHLPLKLGGCDKQARAGPMLFESGLLDQTPVAQAARELVQREPGKWMMSPGLRFKKGDLVNGRYRRCWIAERSLTHKPANLTTAFAVVRDKEMAMVSDELLKEAAEQLGLPFEQIKALAQKYLDTQKEFLEIGGLLKAIKEGVAAEYSPPAQKDETIPTGAAATPVAQPDWAQIIQANTAAMNTLALVVKELAAGKLIDAQVQTAIEDYLQASPQFGSQAKNAGDGDEAVLRAALVEAEKSTDQRATQRQPFSISKFESMFTSQTLNQ